MNTEDIAQAVWLYSGGRTLASGAPPAEPTNFLERVTKEIWEYETRTVTILSGINHNVYLGPMNLIMIKR